MDPTRQESEFWDIQMRNHEHHHSQLMYNSGTSMMQPIYAPCIAFVSTQVRLVYVCCMRVCLVLAYKRTVLYSLQLATAKAVLETQYGNLEKQHAALGTQKDQVAQDKKQVVCVARRQQLQRDNFILLHGG